MWYRVLVMALNVDVQKNQNENSMSLLRRFSRKAKAIGFTRIVRSKRYFERQPSKLRRQQSALARMESAAKYEEMKKLGKIAAN